VSHAEFQARLTAACGLAWRRVAWGISVALGRRGPPLDCPDGRGLVCGLPPLPLRALLGLRSSAGPPSGRSARRPTLRLMAAAPEVNALVLPPPPGLPGLPGPAVSAALAGPAPTALGSQSCPGALGAPRPCALGAPLFLGAPAAPAWAGAPAWSYPEQSRRTSSGQGQKRPRLAPGGGSSGKYSSSYTCYAKLPAQRKLEILASLEPVQFNALYMSTASLLEIDTCLYVATGKLPHCKLDYLERERNLQVLGVEYMRRGCNLRGRDRQDCCAAVQSQQPDVWSLLVAGSQYHGAGAWAGAPSTGSHPLTGATPAAGGPNLGAAAAAARRTGAAAVRLVPAPNGRRLLTDGVASKWLEAGKPWQLVLDHTGALLLSDGQALLPAAAVLASPAAPPACAPEQQLVKPMQLAQPLKGPPGDESVARAAQDAPSPGAPGAPQVELLTCRSGRPFLVDRESGESRVLHRRGSGGSDDWILLTTQDGRQFLDDLAGVFPKMPATAALAAPLIQPAAAAKASPGAPGAPVSHSELGASEADGGARDAPAGAGRLRVPSAPPTPPRKDLLDFPPKPPPASESD